VDTSPVVEAVSISPYYPLIFAGKANGQAYVAIDAAQAPKAFAELNNKFMGKRYVE
jgi:hypothetical protein